ncbi:sulfatase-like hydrolase/transferase [Microbacterium sp. NPDC076911]|uniref:sulfatase-like hydrolase/transferase n=1 Tax=Microbacterium sp. NPDC076911 TaxID=3154958 RepID=UPI003444F84B
MSRPNILQIVADDLGFGDIGCFNFGMTETPGLDSLFREGVELSQHYSASPVCAPARAALLTGRYSHRTGAIDTLDGRGLDRIALDEDTLADCLRASGYATGLVGKWHSGALDDQYHPTNRGFSEFVGFQGGWMDYWDWTIQKNGTAVRTDGRYLTDVWTDEAVDFLQAHSDEPFYLHLAYNAPHAPFQAPEGTDKKHLERGNNPAVATLYAMVEAMDAGIVRVLAELDRLGLRDNTLVMFTSDNGPQMRGHGPQATDRFNCGFRGSKGHTYEGGIRVPGIVRWPNGIEGGRRVDDMVHFTDWYPTILAATETSTVNADLARDGENVLPILRGDAGAVAEQRFWQWNRYRPVGVCNAAMRDGHWKLVLPEITAAMHVTPDDLEMDRALRYEPEQFSQIRTGPLPPMPRVQPGEVCPELYNLAIDPLELNDLAQEEPGRVEAMRAQLETWFLEVNRPEVEAIFMPT